MTDVIIDIFPNRNNIYRTLKAFDINNSSTRTKRIKFKEYEPDYLHIDATYLPKFEKQKYYLFVAIDMATRLLHYKVYENK